MLDINRLRVFRAVVANGSVQGAARHLGYTPSTISQHITALQRETGLVLFEKAGRGIVPTPTGRLLAAESEEVMGSLSRLTGMVDDLRAGHAGSLDIASFSSAAQAWLPGVVRRLREEFPGLVIDLALNEWADRDTRPAPDIDVWVEDVDSEPRENPGQCRQVLAEEAYVCIVPADHALAGRGEIGLVDLAGETWVRDDRVATMCSRIIGRAATAAGVEPNYVARSDDHHTAMAFVAAGVGVVVLPRLAALSAPAGTVTLELHEPTPRRRIVALTRDSSEGRPAVQRALALLAEVARGVDEQRAA
ncbi:LysR family transcriptional regulator [Janibacter sp. Soil728]|uniref:LysR family transcriptional regulator n=1 Tax=Janibacter sp. Soil728 TaxID=1736393 RepID=UPI00138F352E|nr:LysR family transcriptional regulator [Janibacter sp. Soil728]